jgi:hypothetical protein
MEIKPISPRGSACNFRFQINVLTRNRAPRQATVRHLSAIFSKENSKFVRPSICNARETSSSYFSDLSIERNSDRFSSRSLSQAR